MLCFGLFFIYTFVYLNGLNIKNLIINDASENQNNKRNMIWANYVHQIVINDFKNK